MEVIVENKLSNLTATGENANYPALFMLDEHPKKPWKGLLSTETVSFDMASSGRAFGVVKTTAGTINYTIKLEDLTVVETGSVDMTALRNYTEMTTGYPAITWDSAYVTYSRLSVAHKIDIEFVGDTDPVQCGVLVAGEPEVFRNPNWGFQNGLLDTSVKKELAAKTPYYRKRDILRTFSGTILADRDPGFWRFMLRIAQEKGEAPLLWKMTDMPNQYWTTYARFDGMPTGTHDHFNHSHINFNLAEVL